ncbi:MAG: type II secretion system F family protein [Actinobacteria bacterium]|nr:type II secretion system F family protein [Actinomycetota bacterium]
MVEALISLLVAFAVFCVMRSLALKGGRRRTALKLMGYEGISRPAKNARGSFFSKLWNVIDILGKPFSRPPRSEEEDLIREAGLDWTAPRYSGVKRLCGALLCLALLPLGIQALPVLPLAFIAGGRIPTFWLKRRRLRALEGLSADLPEVVDLVAVLCFAGESLQRSLQHSVSAAQHLHTRRVLEEIAEGLRLGEGVAEAVRRVADHPCRELRRFARTIKRAEESGAPVSELLSQLATEMRSARRERNRARAARISVMVLFPLVFMILPGFLLLTVGSMIMGRSL